jgi:hypothetical protein
MVELGRAFSFVTEDEEWISKIVIGGLIQIIPIIGQIALIGYTEETARNVMRGSTRPLPGWQEFGKLLTMGFAGFVISLVYAAPIVLVVFLFGCIIAAIGAASGDSEAGAGLAASFVVCLVPLLILLALALQPLLMAGFARHVKSDSLGDAVRIGEVFGMVRANPKPWLILFLINLLCGMVASVGSIACGVGVLFTTVYAYAVFGHALGQTVAAEMGGSAGGAGSMPPAAGYDSPSGGQW